MSLNGDTNSLAGFDGTEHQVSCVSNSTLYRTKSQ